MSGNNTRKDILWRLYLAFVVICAGGLLISAQIARVQFVEGDAYRTMADSLHTHFEVVPAHRGDIYADNGDLLAASFPFYTIIMDPCAPSAEVFRKNIDSLSYRLSHMFGDRTAAGYRQYITDARNHKKKYLVLDKKVTLPQEQEIEHFPLFRLGRNAGGLITEEEERRIYPYGSLANRTIGYTRNSGVQVGLEGAFDSVLAGSPGHRLVQKMAGGTWLPVTNKNAIEPVDGLDLVTTLDINIQDIAETALRRALVDHDAAWGTAIVMEVKTGQIKAMCNLTREGPGDYDEVLNYAISQKVEPGSTWKLFTLMSLFDDGYSSISDTIDLHNGSWQYDGATMYDSEGHHNMREEPVKTAFAKSSNVGISRLAVKYYGSHPEQYVQHLKDAGLIHPTGIEIPGEQPPFFKLDPSDHNTWYKTTLPWMSVGYELQITPLELLTFYNGIANDGKMMKPYIVKEISQYGDTKEAFKPQVLNPKLCSQHTVDQLKACMLAVVDSGTAKHLHNDVYDFAGKTGTAQLLENGQYVHKYLASFVGYFPADDPKYSILVMVNSPAGYVYYGGYVAAPVFREIADKIYSHYLSMRDPVNASDSSYVGITSVDKGYAEDLENIYAWFGDKMPNPDNAAWITLHASHDTLAVQDLPLHENLMPSVTGMGLRDAMYLLENEGLIVHTSGTGKIRFQSIDAGTTIQKGEEVTLRLE